MYKFQQVDPTKLAWLAGMLQSEGYFYLDARTRSTSNDPTYQPPPPAPMIKIEMVEEDVMQRIGNLVEQKVVKQNRQTTAGKSVYRVNISSRPKVEALLRAILPYIVGQKRNEEIEKLIDVCDDYNKWVKDGGPKKQAKLAANAKQSKKTRAQSEIQNTSSATSKRSFNSRKKSESAKPKTEIEDNSNGSSKDVEDFSENEN